MDKKIIYSILLSIAIVAILIYLFVIKKPVTSTSTSSSPPQQPYVVQTYTLSQAGNILIPLLSENFVVTAEPLGLEAAKALGVTSTTSAPSVSISVWFNIENDTKLHNDSLIINETPITITQETPIIFSDVLKQNNVPYHGYPYLVIAADGPLLIKIAFYI